MTRRPSGQRLTNTEIKYQPVEITIVTRSKARKGGGETKREREGRERGEREK